MAGASAGFISRTHQFNSGTRYPDPTLAPQQPGSNVQTCGDHGGRTADGSPCSRPGDGRCWQHPDPPETNSNGATPGQLVTPAHGRGKIWQGRPANPVAGPGAPPSQVRQALRLGFTERVPVLENIADGVIEYRWVGECEQCGHVGEPLSKEEGDKLADQIPRVRDRIRAIEVMAKHSDLDQKGPDEGLIQELGEVLTELIEDLDLLREIEVRWRRIVGRRLVFGS